MGNMFGQTIQPQAPVSFFNQIYNPSNAQPQGQQLGSAIWNMAFDPNSIASGNPTFQGLPGYQGQINPTVNPNLTSAWSNWQPWNAGNEFVASWLGGGAGQPGQPAGSMPAQPGALAPWASGARANILQFGGPGGAPTQGMSSIAQYGAPSQVGQPMSNFAQFGVGGQGGMPLYNLAMGGPSAASSMLNPFLSARPYAAAW